ncbi:MAG: 4-hydroxythreonine-4-phosphate dehydrogenase PdxA [Thermoanaerobaculia bacterium]
MPDLRSGWQHRAGDAATPAILALTQGDPAGIGPEILLKSLAARFGPFAPQTWNDPGSPVIVLIAERAALEAVAALVPDFPWERLTAIESPDRATLERLDGRIALLDPVAERRTIELGRSGAADARAAMAALDAGIDLARRGVVDAIVTAPVSKESIATHALPGFVGHTDYLAEACGLEKYGRDYLMAFLAPGMQVALLTVHLPLRQAIGQIGRENVLDALACLDRHAGGRIALAGLNPHAGEGGLLGTEETELLAPVVAEARSRGIDVHGPESADSLFARLVRGEFDWALALYHDQGLIAVKSAAFGLATNWTLGLPFLRTSVDHGTAFALAGTGRADASPMIAVLETTRQILAGELPRRGSAKRA